MDEFNLMPMLNNILFALDAAKPASTPALLPFEREPFRRYFPEAGLWVVNELAYYAIVGVSKGGTVSVFDKASRRLTARHSGLVAEHAGRRFTSQDFQLSPSVVQHADDVSLNTTVPWKTLTTSAFGSPLFIAFRLFTSTLGRLPMVSRWVKALLVRVLILRKSRPPVRHARTFRAAADGIHVVDTLETPWASGELQAVEQFTAIHMGSALYVDQRTFGPGPAIATFPLRQRMTLRGALTIAGASWQADRA
jgi:hypothetical protein